MMMDGDDILKGMSDEDVISFTLPARQNTFCVSQFRQIVEIAKSSMKNAYGESLINQGHHLHTAYDHNNRRAIYDGWFNDSGIKCKSLHLGDSQWKHGKVRVRIEVEFIPDGEEDSNQIDENPLDTFRER